MLLEAIDNAPVAQLQRALRIACEISEEASKTVQEMLLVAEELVSYKIVEKDVDSEGCVDEDESDEDEEDDEEASGDDNDGKEY